MNINLGEIITFHRKRSGLSRNKLADLAGVGKTAIYDIEKNKKTIKLETLLKVLHSLNIKLVLDSPLMKEYTQNEKS